MIRWLAVLTTVVALTAASPAIAEEPGMASGVFRLTIEGEVPGNVSFYVEDDLGGGVICTTDAAMVESGYPECAGGGAVNELVFEAPAGEEFWYRIVGSRGVELSRFVVVEGSATAEEGLVVNAAYAFPASEGEDTVAAPVAEQYGQDAPGIPGGGSPSGAPEARPGDPTGGTGALPDTGGVSVLLTGGALLAASGAFIARRLTS